MLFIISIFFVSGGELYRQIISRLNLQQFVLQQKSLIK